MCRTIPKPSSLTRCDKVLTNQQIQSPLKLTSCHHPTPVHLGIVNDSHRSIGMSRDLWTYVLGPGRGSFNERRVSANQSGRKREISKEAKSTPRKAIRTPDSLLRNSHEPLIAKPPSDAPSLAMSDTGIRLSSIGRRPHQERDVTDLIGHLAYPPVLIAPVRAALSRTRPQGRPEYLAGNRHFVCSEHQLYLWPQCSDPLHRAAIDREIRLRSVEPYRSGIVRVPREQQPVSAIEEEDRIWRVTPRSYDSEDPPTQVDASTLVQTYRFPPRSRPVRRVIEPGRQRTADLTRRNLRLRNILRTLRVVMRELGVHSVGSIELPVVLHVIIVSVAVQDDDRQLAQLQPQSHKAASRSPSLYGTLAHAHSPRSGIQSSLRTGVARRWQTHSARPCRPRTMGSRQACVSAARTPAAATGCTTGFSEVPCGPAGTDSSSMPEPIVETATT
jgi:hypothetical protein